MSTTRMSEAARQVKSFWSDEPSSEGDTWVASAASSSISDCPMTAQAVVLDVRGRKIVDWSMKTTLRAEVARRASDGGH